MANAFVHVELNTIDNHRHQQGEGLLQQAVRLEAGGRPMPGGSYTMISEGEGTGGGMMKQLMERVE